MSYKVKNVDNTIQLLIIHKIKKHTYFNLHSLFCLRRYMNEKIQIDGSTTKVNALDYLFINILGGNIFTSSRFCLRLMINLSTITLG